MNAIQINNLSKIYKGKRGSRVEALKDLSLEMGTGEIFGFLGPNGAGKSTTIKTLMGLIRPTAGTATIMGLDISSNDARRHVGYLPENPALYDYLSAEEYLWFVGRSFGMKPTVLQGKTEGVLHLLELWDSRKRPMRSYSKGMVQRVGLAQALIHDPDVYILDEPMSGLDPLGRALVKNIIQDLKRQGKCVFFSSHITSDVETVCDRVGVIVKGELKCVKRVEEITVDGITGYEIRYVRAGTTASLTEMVAKENLPEKLSELQAAGYTLLMVEPLRKSLEDFFVDIVQKDNKG